MWKPEGVKWRAGGGGGGPLQRNAPDHQWGFGKGEVWRGLFVKAREHLPLGPLTLPSSSRRTISIPPPLSSHEHSALVQGKGQLFQDTLLSALLLFIWTFFFFFFASQIYCVHMARVRPVYLPFICECTWLIWCGHNVISQTFADPHLWIVLSILGMVENSEVPFFFRLKMRHINVPLVNLPSPSYVTLHSLQMTVINISVLFITHILSCRISSCQTSELRWESMKVSVCVLRCCSRNAPLLWLVKNFTFKLQEASSSPRVPLEREKGKRDNRVYTTKLLKSPFWLVSRWRQAKYCILYCFHSNNLHNDGRSKKRLWKHEYGEEMFS